MRWDYTISLTWLITWASAVSAGYILYRRFLRPVLIFINEHDLMWEEYCRRHGLDFRIMRNVRGKPKREYRKQHETCSTPTESKV